MQVGIITATVEEEKWRREAEKKKGQEAETADYSSTRSHGEKASI